MSRNNGMNESMNRRTILKGMSVGGASLVSTAGIVSARRGRRNRRGDLELSTSQFASKSVAADDVAVIEESGALADLRETIQSQTGREPSHALPLSIQLQANDPGLNSYNPSFAISLLKDPKTDWEETTPADLGLAFAFVLDEHESGLSEGVAVTTRDGTSRVPVSAGAVSIHGEGGGVSAQSRGHSAESSATYKFFGSQEDGTVATDEHHGQAPQSIANSKGGHSVSAQSFNSSPSAQPAELPSELPQDVVASYQSGGVSAQSIHGEIGCTACQSIIPAICAGTGALGYWGCLARCVPLASSYPVLAGGCALFCEYVTSVSGVTLCAAAPPIICGQAFNC